MFSTIDSAIINAINQISKGGDFNKETLEKYYLPFSNGQWTVNEGTGRHTFTLSEPRELKMGDILILTNKQGRHAVMTCVKIEEQPQIARTLYNFAYERGQGVNVYHENAKPFNEYYFNDDNVVVPDQISTGFFEVSDEWLDGTLKGIIATAIFNIKQLQEQLAQGDSISASSLKHLHANMLSSLSFDTLDSLVFRSDLTDTTTYIQLANGFAVSFNNNFNTLSLYIDENTATLYPDVKAERNLTVKGSLIVDGVDILAAIKALQGQT